MSEALLDVNVLVALAWPNHVHHEWAHRWMRRGQDRDWATCSVTQAGFVRVSSNRSALPYARPPLEALDLLRRMTELPGHVFWPDDVDLARVDWIREVPLVGHRQVTDVHLLALALARGGRVATFDRSLVGLLPRSVNSDRCVELIA